MSENSLPIKKEWDSDSINFRKAEEFKSFVSHKTIVEFILGLECVLKLKLVVLFRQKKDSTNIYKRHERCSKFIVASSNSSEMF